MSNEIDALDKMFSEMIEKFPDAKKTLVKNSGKKLFNKVKENIDNNVKEKKGNLKKGVTLVEGSGGGYSAVKPDWGIAPHTGLIENGHTIIRGKKGAKQRDIGFAPGKHMYRNADIERVEELAQDAETTLQKMVGDTFG